MANLDWKNVLGAVAPTVATALGGPLAGMAVKAIGGALGIDEPTQVKIEEAITSGNMTGEQLAALKQADTDFKLKLRELDIKEEELHVMDRKSARDMQVATRSWVPAALSVITVSGFFFLLGGSAMGKLQLTGSDVMMLLLGVLARETASVYQFWLGSSSSSQNKTDLLAKK
jgi:hypothetical protein